MEPKVFEGNVEDYSGTIYQLLEPIMNAEYLSREQSFTYHSLNEFLNKADWPLSENAIFRRDIDGKYILIDQYVQSDTDNVGYICGSKWHDQIDSCIKNYVANYIENAMYIRNIDNFHIPDFIYSDFKIVTPSGIFIRAEDDYHFRLSDGGERDYLIHIDDYEQLVIAFHKDFAVNEIMYWISVENDYVFNPAEHPEMMEVEVLETGYRGYKFRSHILKREYILDMLYKQEKEYYQEYASCINATRSDGEYKFLVRNKAFLNLKTGELDSRGRKEYEKFFYTWYEFSYANIEAWTSWSVESIMQRSKLPSFEEFINMVNEFYDEMESDMRRLNGEYVYRV